MHRPGRQWEEASERTAWVLDDVWPETASMVAAAFKPGDQLIAPGILQGFPARYNWPVAHRTPAIAQTIASHWAMRRVARASGGVRQRSYLEHDRALARQLARSIDHRLRHLVVAQSWLPWLDETGALGGRTFDVMMSRYPLSEIHHLLDAAAKEIGRSATIADFRADPSLVAREAELLARARRIITPHHGIAALFPGTALLLTWHPPSPAMQSLGTRIAFLGPTIARQRPDLARTLAAALPEPLIVFGPLLEPCWDGMPIERRAFGPGWLEGIGAILHRDADPSAACAARSQSQRRAGLCDRHLRARSRRLSPAGRVPGAVGGAVSFGASACLHLRRWLIPPRQPARQLKEADEPSDRAGRR